MQSANRWNHEFRKEPKRKEGDAKEYMNFRYIYLEKYQKHSPALFAENLKNR